MKINIANPAYIESILRGIDSAINHIENSVEYKAKQGVKKALKGAADVFDTVADGVGGTTSKAKNLLTKKKTK